ncbi:unnamed protein product [Triticum turgidum subsp. durum]|uniref:Uncharacterized protein n=2 Tax=Triticum TaxID=4564 RepID=A0A9R0TZR4_TRITD|nr:unnamed protein product [Triticum turgidum subsp. durum]
MGSLASPLMGKRSSTSLGPPPSVSTPLSMSGTSKKNLEAPLDKVCVLSCGISTGLGATLNVAKPKKGDDPRRFCSTPCFCRLKRIMCYNQD